MSWLYDIHIHLSDIEYEPIINHILANMKHMKIKACCVSTDNHDSIKTLELSRLDNNVLPFIGIHPERAADDLEKMTHLITTNHDQIVGIGEIGLDKTLVSSPEELNRQKVVFETLLELAEKYSKPVSIHSRGTLPEIYDILSSFDLQVLLHWFSGSKKQLRTAMDLNYYVSYGPLVLYAPDKQVLLSKTDLDKIVVETDGPVRFSRCFGFKPAQVSFIPSVVFCASKILGLSFDETCKVLENNSKKFLKI